MPDYSEYQPMSKKRVDMNNPNEALKKKSPLDSNLFGNSTSQKYPQ
jgi:hypothetical protein